MFDKIIRWQQNLPDNKKYIELITGLLSIPVLITVLYGNVSGLSKNEAVPTPSIQPTIQYITPESTKNEPTPTPTQGTTPSPTTTISPTNEVCIKKVGPSEIITPKENETVIKDPLSIEISHDGKYCSVAWAYRINNGLWSEYNDKAINAYNLPSGEKTLEVKIKSIASDDEILLKRIFTYKNPNETITPSQTATQAATPNP